MSLQTLINTYGYLALFLGALFEGETVVVIAGFSAHQGYLDLKQVVLISFLGSLLGDQFYFYVGRIKGRKFIDQRVTWKKRVARIQSVLEKHQNLLLFSFRFLYGFRTVTPFVVGVSNIKATKFTLFNGLSALMWAVMFSIAGFLFGNTIELLFAEMRSYEEEIICVIALIGILVWAIRFYIQRKPNKK
jgi:membrane protein DedA with SNARE-associated domain